MLKTRFNDGWKFRVNSGGSFPVITDRDIPIQDVLLPHDAVIAVPRDGGNIAAHGNGYFVEQNYVYTKNFILNPADEGKCVWLEFEGVYQNAMVYINESFACRCPYGYSNFYIDATKFVYFHGENSIKVAVKNGVQSGRWYTGGGIYRDVNLMVGDRLHIVPDGVRITCTDVEPEMAILTVDVELEYKGLGQRDVYLVTEILDCQGKVVTKEQNALTAFEGEKSGYHQTLYVENPNLWDDQSPYLYSYHSYLVDRGIDQVVDEEIGTFGIRKLQVDPIHGLRVNGRVVKLRGGCIHHDNGIIGSAEFYSAEEFRIKRLKEAGYNAIRSAHHPMSKTLLNVCDQYGMYVMDEFSDVWTSTKVAFDYGIHMPQWWERDVENMIRKDYNHPSVIMYSIGNEIPELANKIDVQWGKRLVDKFRSLDSTRFITNGMNLLLSILHNQRQIAGAGVVPGATKEDVEEINSLMTRLGKLTDDLNGSDLFGKVMEEATSQLDIAGYNYAAVRYVRDHELYPNRIVVGTETYPKDLDYNWDIVRKYPHVIGDFSWTAWDYLGEAGIGKFHYGDCERTWGYEPYPCKAAYCGDMNLLGERRPVSFWREIIWGLRSKPYLCVQHPEHYGQKKHRTNWCSTDAVRSWTYPGYEGKPIVVEVYSDAQEAELLLDGKVLARKPLGEEKSCIAKFDTTYQPGQLEVVVYTDGVEQGRDYIQTASEKVHLTAWLSKSSVPADGSDISYVDVSVVDDNGIRNTSKVLPVAVTISGPGILQGYGSADPDSTENYYDTSANTYEGRIRAAVRGTGESGEITVTFSAPGCSDCVVSIAAV